MKNIWSKLISISWSRRLYVLLLIVTPFLLLQNYLQSAIGQLSDSQIVILNFSFPLVVLVLLVLVVTIAIFNYRKLTITRGLGWCVIVLMFWLGQRMTDFYFNHKFYELQYNWHYFAYGIYAYINYRELKSRNKEASFIIIHTLISALLISGFDELVQVPLSNRIFDVGDIAKDLWGAVIGLIFVFFILENGSLYKRGESIRELKWHLYKGNPLALMILGVLTSFVFLVVASVLTETQYLGFVMLWSIFISFVLIGIWHYSQFRRFRIFLMSLILILASSSIYFRISNNSDPVKIVNQHLVLIDGIPIFYFDLIVFPNSWFQLVDKKVVFNARDQRTIQQYADHIVIIANGSKGQGGKGFPRSAVSQFMYNEARSKGQQFIILPNKQAVAKYNDLKNEGKNPLLIYHNQ